MSRMGGGDRSPEGTEPPESWVSPPPGRQSVRKSESNPLRDVGAATQGPPRRSVGPARAAGQLSHHTSTSRVRRGLGGRHHRDLTLARPDRGQNQAVLAFDQQLSNLGDLCRQLVRAMGNLRAMVEPDARRDASGPLSDLRRHIDVFLEAD